MIPAAGTPEFNAWCTSLQLSPRDLADAARLFALAGDRPSCSVTPSPTTSRERAELAEPREHVNCPRCDEIYSLEVYLLECLRTWDAPVPECFDCRRGTP